MIHIKVSKEFRVPIILEKEIAHIDPTIWINKNNFHLMKLRLIEGVWVRVDATGIRRMEVGWSSASKATTFIAINETFELLRSHHLKYDHFFKHISLKLKKT